MAAYMPEELIPSPQAADKSPARFTSQAMRKSLLTRFRFLIIIVKLGDYLNRKCDGVPGFESMWRGYARFYDMVEIIVLERAAKSTNA